MTTYATSTRLRMDSDAVYQEWVTEIHTALVACGCVQTADTGQINPATVTRPATNTFSGFLEYYINDSLHGTYPIYFKVYVGTGAAAGRIRLGIEVGTATSGAGVLTNSSGQILCGSTTTAALTVDTPYNSYWCLANSCVSMIWKMDRSATLHSMGGFVLGRPTDGTGAPVANSIFLHTHNRANGQTPSIYSTSFNATTAAWLTERNYGWAATSPGYYYSEATQDISGNTPVWVGSYRFDQPRPTPQVLVGNLSDFTVGSTYSITPIGATPHTYLCIRNQLGVCGDSWDNTTAYNAVQGLVIYE